MGSTEAAQYKNVLHSRNVCIGTFIRSTNVHFNMFTFNLFLNMIMVMGWLFIVFKHLFYIKITLFYKIRSKLNGWFFVGLLSKNFQIAPIQQGLHWGHNVFLDTTQNTAHSFKALNIWKPALFLDCFLPFQPTSIIFVTCFQFSQLPLLLLSIVTSYSEWL